MRSIRRYLTLWLLVGIGVTVLGAAIVVLAMARDELTREFDRGLLGKAQGLGSLLEVDAGGVEFEAKVTEVMPLQIPVVEPFHARPSSGNGKNLLCFDDPEEAIEQIDQALEDLDEQAAQGLIQLDDYRDQKQALQEQLQDLYPFLT